MQWIFWESQNCKIKFIEVVPQHQTDLNTLLSSSSEIVLWKDEYSVDLDVSCGQINFDFCKWQIWWNHFQTNSAVAGV